MKKKALILLLTVALCLALLPMQAGAAEDSLLRMEGTNCIFTHPMWNESAAIRLTNVSELTTTNYFFSDDWPYDLDCAVVYGQTTLTLLRSGYLEASRWNGKRGGSSISDVTERAIKGSNAVIEPSEKNIGATLTLTEPGFYYVPYAVGGDYSFFSIEVRPVLPKAATPNAAYTAYLKEITDLYGIMPQFDNGDVPNDLVVQGPPHPTGLFYGALVDFDGNGAQEMLVLYYEGAADDYFGLTCEVWSADSGVLRNVYSNKENWGDPFYMASNGPLGSLGLTQVDGKPYLHTLHIGYTGSTKVEVDTFYTLASGKWKPARVLEWGHQTPDAGGEVHSYWENEEEVTAAAYQAVRSKWSAGETVLASTLTDGWSLHIGVPNYHAAVKTFLTSLDSLKTAKPTASAVLVDGRRVEFDAYTIDGNNYFKLRDIAAVLSGTQKLFDVRWDGAQNAISLHSGTPYTKVGGELSKGGATGGSVTPSNASLLLDGAPLQLTVYTISGNNYFKLRDLGEAFDFAVSWDGATSTVSIDTTSPYIPEA